MIIPTLKTWIDDEVVTPQMMNEQVRDVAEFVFGPPSCAADGGFQTVTDPSTFQPVVFDSVKLDTDNMIDLVANNDRVTFTTPGLYILYGQVAWSAGGTGRRFAQISLNGTVAAESRAELAPGSVNHVAAPVMSFTRLVAGDYMQLHAFQSSTGPVNIGQFSPCQIGAVWIAV